MARAERASLLWLFRDCPRNWLCLTSFKAPAALDAWVPLRTENAGKQLALLHLGRRMCTTSGCSLRKEKRKQVYHQLLPLLDGLACVWPRWEVSSEDKSPVTCCRSARKGAVPQKDTRGSKGLQILGKLRSFRPREPASLWKRLQSTPQLPEALA